ncbi:hypothetical protein [Halomonas sp.]|uniref:hypothetical protein n=1 Tax=Halomonas sp. TaxID=1486246 RepID=UPI003568FF12
MTASRTPEVRHSRVKLLALIAVFALPMLVAWVMVTWRIGIPDERTAHGQLAPDLPSLSEWPVAGPNDALDTGDWILAFDCSSNCEVMADQWWRVHRALGREAPRVSRLRIGGSSDTLPGEMVTQWSTRPDWQQPGQVWILDPRGRVVLSYSVEVDAEDVLADVNRLLRINPEAPVHVGREVARR